MTQPQQQAQQSNPWQQAAQQFAPPASQQQYQPAGQQQSEQGNGGGSLLAGAYAPPAPSGPSGLMSDRLFGQQRSAPSLFNKTHFIGTERTGIILDAPRDVQDQDFDSRRPKYFSKSKVGVPVPAITTDVIDGPTGERNDPVMSLHFDLQTDYRMTEQECFAVNREPSFVREDDGTRVEVIGGRDLKAFRKAMQEYVAAGGKLEGKDDLKGLRLTSRRSGQVPAGANKAWVREFKLSKP